MRPQAFFLPIEEKALFSKKFFTMIETQATAQKPSKKRKTIPSYLVRDVIGGEPYYYKGWQAVVNGTKTFDDIMGCSSLQAVIIGYLTQFYYTKINNPALWFFTGESGNNLRKKVNMSFDVAVYDKKDLPVSKISPKYANVPPKMVIEIDLKVDPEEKTELEVIQEKTQELLDYGVEKVMWVLTTTRQVLIATPGKDWIFRNWDKEVEFMEGHLINIGKHLKSEGIPTVSK